MQGKWLQEVKLQQESGAQYLVSLWVLSHSFGGYICNGNAKANIVELLYGGHQHFVPLVRSP